MQITPGQRLRDLNGPVMLTGHTGFKGTWMTILLEQLNVPVVGYSLQPEKNSLYDRTNRIGAIPEIFADIRDDKTLDKFIYDHKPSAIIHMAAQPLVLESYQKPRETFKINVMGTVNVLSSAFSKDFIKAVLVVTTDKVYKNNDSGVPFVENDALEGHDPYSSSKVATESVVTAWQVISGLSNSPKVFSARSGNVIGGGDISKDRLLADLVKGWLSHKIVFIRNPSSTRPWQHVLDPLYGYLLAIEHVLNGGEIKTINFAPKDKSIAVKEIVNLAQSHFPIITSIDDINQAGNSTDRESKFLNIDPSLASIILKWETQYSQSDSIIKTLEWWKNHILLGRSAHQLCKEEIEEFLNKINNNSLHPNNK